MQRHICLLEYYQSRLQLIKIGHVIQTNHVAIFVRILIPTPPHPLAYTLLHTLYILDTVN